MQPDKDSNELYFDEKKDLVLNHTIIRAFKEMIISSTDYSFIKDKNLVYLCCSRAFAMAAGLPDEDSIIGKTDYDIFSSDLARKYRADDRKLMEHKLSLIDFIEHLPSKDGIRHYSNTSKYLIKDTDGSILGIFGIGRDITENRNAYDRLKLLTDSIPGGITMLEYSKSGIRILYISDGIYKTCGYSSSEYNSRSEADPYFMLYKDDVNKLKDELDKVLNSENLLDCTYRIIQKSGEIRWVNLRGIPTGRTESGITINAVLLDVTEQKRAEVRLAASRRAMELANINGSIAFWYYNIDEKTINHDILGMNSPLGYPAVLENIPESMIATGDVAHESSDVIREMFNSINNGKKTVQCTIKMKNRISGEYEWQRIICTTIDDPDNISRNAIGFAINVNLEQENRLRYEHELQLRHELIKNSVVYYQLNLTAGKIEEYYSSLNDVEGMQKDVDADDNIRQKLLQNVHPDYKDKVRNTIFSDALMNTYKRGETTANLIYQRMIPGLGYRWVEANASIMEKPDSGEITAFLHCKNIDSYMKGQLAIADIMNEEIDSVIMINIESRIARLLHINNLVPMMTEQKQFDFDTEFHRIIGITVVEEDKKACFDFFILENMQKKLQTENVIKITYRSHIENGVIQRKKARAFYLDDTKEEIVLIKRDITDLYEEEQRQKKVLQDAIDTANAANHSKSDFLSHMSHDMRTPLNAVLSFSNREMTNTVSEDKLREYLDKIHYAGEYLLGIINDVLDMSRIEQNKINLNPEPYSMNDFGMTISNIINELSKNKRINFIFDTSNVVYQNVMVDKIRFNQIFINLLSNSVKFTPEGGTIEFIVEPFYKKEGSVIRKRFIVRDNGIGMSEEFIPHAFDSFQQEYHKGVTESIQGTGLGLSIVRELVNLMGGTITVESRVNIGTTFTVDLPITIAEDNNNTDTGVETDDSILNGMRILLAEDNEINAEIAVTLLERKGCIIDCVENGRDACEKFEQAPEYFYNVILMDIRMPVMDGLEAAKYIRKLDRLDSGEVRIIAMTADAFNEDEQTALEAGMNNHLPKPIVPRMMYDMLKEVMKNR